MPALAKKLALGTVQWGMSYGIANRDGRPSTKAVDEILTIARAAGISLLDTAQAYGDAEAVIGSCVNHADAFEVVTKTKPLKDARIGAPQIAEISEAFATSRARLAGWTLRGMLVHHCHNLLIPGGEDLWALLTEWKASGQVRQIGVSVYTPAQAIECAERFALDFVQLPLNLYDQRFLRSGTLAALKSRGIEIHVRSAFLQGLLLMDPDALPHHFASIRAHHARFVEDISRAGTTALAAALRFCLERHDVDRVVVGCESPVQLREILAAAGDAPGRGPTHETLAIDDETIINPSLWRLSP